MTEIELLEERIVFFFSGDCSCWAVAGVDLCFSGEGEEFFSDAVEQL